MKNFFKSFICNDLNLTKDQVTLITLKSFSSTQSGIFSHFTTITRKKGSSSLVKRTLCSPTISFTISGYFYPSFTMLSYSRNFSGSKKFSPSHSVFSHSSILKLVLKLSTSKAVVPPENRPPQMKRAICSWVGFFPFARKSKGYKILLRLASSLRE